MFIFCRAYDNILEINPSPSNYKLPSQFIILTTREPCIYTTGVPVKTQVAFSNPIIEALHYNILHRSRHFTVHCFLFQIVYFYLICIGLCCVCLPHLYYNICYSSSLKVFILYTPLRLSHFQVCVSSLHTRVPFHCFYICHMDSKVSLKWA